MTCCVAVICDDGKTIVMVADRMVGIGIIESEPAISKLRELHKGWWVLFAGDDISSIFDVVDYARLQIQERKKAEHADVDSPISLRVATEAIQGAYQRKRMEDAETLYLRPIGLDIKSINSEGYARPDFKEVVEKLQAHSLPIEMLVAGFSEGQAHLFTLIGYGEQKGLARRLDIPGFSCIGSGGLGADYMLYYRDMGPKKQLREALYYAMEAKIFGEQASGVGEDTDAYIATADGKFIPLDEKKSIEGALVKVWNLLRPHRIGKNSRELLNSIPELDEFPKLETEKS